MEVAVDQAPSHEYPSYMKGTVAYENKVTRGQSLPSTDSGARWKPAIHSPDPIRSQTAFLSQSMERSTTQETISMMDSLTETPRYMHGTSTWINKVSTKSMVRAHSTPQWSVAGIDHRPRAEGLQSRCLSPSPSMRSTRSGKKPGWVVESAKPRTPVSEGNATRSQTPLHEEVEPLPKRSVSAEPQDIRSLENRHPVDKDVFQSRCFSLAGLPRFFHRNGKSGKHATDGSFQKGSTVPVSRGEEVDKKADGPASGEEQQQKDMQQGGVEGLKQDTKAAPSSIAVKATEKEQAVNTERTAHTPEPRPNKRQAGQFDPLTPRFMRCTEAWEGKVQEKKKLQSSTPRLPPRVANAKRGESMRSVPHTPSPMSIAGDKAARAEQDAARKAQATPTKNAALSTGAGDDQKMVSHQKPAHKNDEASGRLTPPQTPPREKEVTKAVEGETPKKSESASSDPVTEEGRETSDPSLTKHKKIRPAKMVQKLAIAVGLKK